MKKSLLLLIILGLALVSCHQNRHVGPVTPVPVNVQTVEPFDAPAWLWDLPDGQYAIGIAYSDGISGTAVGSSAEIAAKEYAAVCMSRSKSSFVVDNKIVVMENDEQILNQMNFNVVVSADPQIMHTANEKLKLVDKIDHKGYFIGLYGYNKTKVNNEIWPMTMDNLPDWTKLSVSKDNKNLYATGMAVEAYLMTALFTAHENAAKELGRYKKQLVMSILKSVNDRVDKKGLFETLTRSYDSYIDKVHIVMIKNNQTPSFRAYVRLKTNAYLPTSDYR